MKTKLSIPFLALPLALSLAACGNNRIEARETSSDTPSSREEEAVLPPSPYVEREFWLALAEEPRSHLDAARGFLENENPEMAAVEMGKVAALLKFETNHSHSPEQANLLLASVDELREIARQLRVDDDNDPLQDRLVTMAEMDRVSALVLRSVAAHQVALARDALDAGDGRMAGLLMREAATVIQTGFQRSETPASSALSARLSATREVGLRMQMDGDGSRAEGLATLKSLDEAVKELGNVVTERRR